MIVTKKQQQNEATIWQIGNQMTDPILSCFSVVPDERKAKARTGESIVLCSSAAGWERKERSDRWV